MADLNLGLRTESKKLRDLMRRQDEMMTDLYKEKVWLPSIAAGFAKGMIDEAGDDDSSTGHDS